jgi:hypothetical protein
LKKWRKQQADTNRIHAWLPGRADDPRNDTKAISVQFNGKKQWWEVGELLSVNGKELAEGLRDDVGQGDIIESSTWRAIWLSTKSNHD